MNPLSRFVCTILAAAFAAAPALANLDLAKKSNCMSCHMVEKRVVGPSFQEVAKKYAGNAEAQKILFEKVKKGGKGGWGEIPMPPNGHVKDADIETLVKWVLGSGG
jgi:cytochrome c